jgi:aldehyde:ferredoxin oxidoreductase
VPSGEDIAMIYRIDLETQQVTREEGPPEWAGLGGRALTSAIVAAEVPPRAWPLGPENRLVIAPGLLGASGASSTGRLSIGAKSPLTGTIKESNTGGRPGQQLARLGISALVFSRPAQPPRWCLAVVRATGIELHPADGLVGRDVYATVEQLLRDYGDKAGVLAIGPAG